MFWLSSARAQLDAPGAFSTFSGCRHNTCLWVPQADHIEKFRRGSYTYFVENAGETGATFVLLDHANPLLRTELKDLDASVSVVWNASNSAFAVTWSDGGAIGNFHVRAFGISKGETLELPAVDRAESDFKRKHFCPSRGNNVQAYSWRGDDKLVLVTSVYNTGDCRPDLGHMEAYLVRATDGAILKHMSLASFKEFAKAHPE